MKQASIVLLYLFAACSTVQEVQVPSASRTEFPELAVAPSVRTGVSDKREPGVHSPDGKLKFFLSRGAPLANVNRSMQETALLRVLRSIRFRDVDYVTLDDPMGKPVALDGRLSLTFEAGKTTNEFTIAARLKEEEEGVKIQFRIEPAAAPEQLEISHTEGISILRSPSSLRVASDTLRIEEIHNMLTDSIMGTLDVQSSSAETVVSLKGSSEISVGPAPVSKKVLEGSYTLIAARKGHAPQQLPVKIFAGEKRRVFIAWPDDPASATTAFVSAPTGLRLAIDDDVKGPTPIYLLNESAHKVEFARKLADGRFEVVGTANPSGDDRNRAMLLKYTEAFMEGYLESDIWQMVTEKSVKPLKGIRSRPFIVDEQKTTVSFPLSEGSAFIAWVSDQDSIFVERIGNVFTVQGGKGSAMSGPKKAFQPIKEKPDRTILIEYNSKKSIVTVELDGTSIFEGPFRPSATGQIVILGPDQMPIKKLDVRTGRGVYEE
ncbi:MAG TPA: hypothetical protein PKA91_06885 [Leptospiraceae bacterium]|nr:hypothetical protein [Leptospiraceae bacterium]HNJ02921.1 hypothetical protein [Leptospiraceae bacterium]HNL02935.1 hypothetical protein [Leptospiraceae bacterium]